MSHRLLGASLLLLWLCPSSPAGARAGDTADLIAADAARTTAMVSGDMAALDRLLGDELTYVHSTGALDSKPRLLEELRTHELRYRSIASREAQARVYGDAGVIVGIATMQVEKGAMSRALTLRYTASYVMRQGRWQLVAYQSTLLPDAAQ